MNLNELARTEGIVSTLFSFFGAKLKIQIIFSSTLIKPRRQEVGIQCLLDQDPSLLAPLTPAQLAAINSISDDDLAPPPSEEDIFGKTEALKQQFAEDNDRIAQQMAENEVRFSSRVTCRNVQEMQFCCLDISPCQNCITACIFGQIRCDFHICKNLLILPFDGRRKKCQIYNFSRLV